MDREVQVGPLVAALGALILAISLFLDWWDGLTAFTAYELLDLVLLGLAVTMVVSLAGGMGLIRTAVSPGVTLAVAVVTVVIVVSQLINDPPIVSGGAREHAFGIWLALIGGVLMVGGSLLAYAHISLAVDVRPRGGARAAESDATAPPAAEPPPAEAEQQRSSRSGADDATERLPGRPAPVDPDAPADRF